MLINYLKLAFRNLQKYKTYSFLHIVGLTVGIACIILIIKYVQYELSYDKFNSNAGNIYRITGYDWAQTQVPLSNALVKYFPEITNTVRIHKDEKVLISYGEKKFYEEEVIFADPSVFDVFTFPLLEGNPHSALNDPYSVVITQSISNKYFGNSDPIGKKINYNEKYDFTVTGVLKDIPKNSHLKFDFIFSLNCAGKVFYKDFFENNMNTVVFNYFQLRENSNLVGINARLIDFTKYFIGEALYNSTREDKWRVEYNIQPLASVHLHSNLGGEFEPNGDIKDIYIFSVIALLILIIASINYINLTIARYLGRIKEIGIRKVLGADKSQIILLFVSESVLSTFISVAIALAFAELFSPFLGSSFGNREMFSGSGNEFIIPLIVIAAATGLISGLYPAFYISKYHPVQILSKSVIVTNKGFSFKNLLISFQFIVSIVLIIAAILVSSQLSYIQNKKLGFNKEQIIVVPLNDESINGQYNAYRAELLKLPGIVNVAASSTIPGGVKWVRSFQWEDERPEEDNTLCFICADQEFLKTYQINIIEGRNFTNSFSTDTASGFLVNETALAKLGLKSPVGKRIETFGKKGSIIGIMKDFYFKSFHEKIEPLVIYSDPGNFKYLSIRIKTKDIPGIIKYIDTKWGVSFPGKPFEYFFLDDYWSKLYDKEQNIGNLFGVFSGLAIFIASLGLFGLAAFSAQNKIKEIGIRKVLGASVTGIVLKLSVDFTKWVLFANLVAWPIAYYFMNKWLQNFAYKVEISWWMFVLSGIIALLVALLTIITQAIKSAMANPVESLKYE